MPTDYDTWTTIELLREWDRRFRALDCGDITTRRGRLAAFWADPDRRELDRVLTERERKGTGEARA